MKIRVISGAIGVAVLLLVLFVLPAAAMNVCVAALCAIASVELLYTTRRVHHRGVLTVSAMFAAFMPLCGLADDMTKWLLTGLFLYVLVLVIIQLISYKTMRAEEVGYAFFMTLIFPLSLTCLAYLRGCSVRDGVFYVFLTLAISWMNDTGAYFTGTFLGKHKMSPHISPKKTWEGFAGGVITTLIGVWIIALIYQSAFLDVATVNVGRTLLLALAGSPLSVLGDLMASLIKRQSGIKDYGHLMPGHGGVMDRFDSVLLVAPLVALWLRFWPLIVG